MRQDSPISHPCTCHNLDKCHTGEAGRLFLWFPMPHTLAKVTPYLEQTAIAYELMPERPGLSLNCKAGQAQEPVSSLAQRLAPRELSETHVLFMRVTVPPQLQDFSDMVSLPRFLKFAQSDWLVEILETERFTSHFQPIVSIQDTSQIYGYEALLRGLDT